MHWLRIHLWSVIALAAMVVFLAGLLLLNGGAQAVAGIASVLVFLIAWVRARDPERNRKGDGDVPSPPGRGRGPRPRF